MSSTNHTYLFILTLLYLWLGIPHMSSQVVLTPEAAVQAVLENNFDIRIAGLATEIAENNASKFNTGQLPTIAMDGGASYSLDNITANFQDGNSTTLNGAASESANVSLNVGYTIFDGFMRKYNIEQLGQRYQLSLLQAEATIENLIAQTMVQYYEVAALQKNLNLFRQTIDVSGNRLERAQQLFDYGQANGLVVLNARVDLNTDSLNYANARIALENEKRALSRLMVDTDNLDYTVVTDSVVNSRLDKDALFEDVLLDNTNLELIDKNIEIGHLSINLAEARRLPSVDANASYGFFYNNNNSASFLASSQVHGLNLGLTARWNIFDGGATRVAIDNARINLETLELEKARAMNDVQFEFNTAWANYENAHYIYNAEQTNLAINRQNFERSVEQFRIGQLTSVDFRQAQINLLNAETRLTNAVLDIKIAEVQLLLLSGRLLQFNE